MNPTTDLPDDAALPGIVAMRTLGVTRALGLVRALFASGLEDAPVTMQLVGYSPGERATLEVGVGQRHLAVKAYAEDPTPEVVLYQALAAAGLSGDSGVRVPPLLAWDRDLRVIVIGWLEGGTAHELVKQGRGQRAGELAAQWLRCAASLPVRLGPPFGVARMLHLAREWVGRLASKVHVVKRRKADWVARAHALLAEAARLVEDAQQSEPVVPAKPRAFKPRGAALELVLQALSTRPATPEELDQIRKLLDATDDRAS